MLVTQVENGRELLSLLYRLDVAGNTRLFRGQADSSWGLRPGLFRPEVAPNQDLAILQKYESLLLGRLRRVLSEHTFTPERALDNPGYLLAFAQHYGVPTRFLDWTYSPLFAAYFAVADAMKRHPESGLFSVFAAERIGITLRSVFVEESTGVVFGEGPGNENLRAQQGALVQHAWTEPDMWDASKSRQVSPVELERKADTHDLIKIDVPATGLASLYGFLVQHGACGVAAFPGNAGLAKFAFEKALQFASPEVRPEIDDEGEEQFFVPYLPKLRGLREAASGLETSTPSARSHEGEGDDGSEG